MKLAVLAEQNFNLIDGSSIWLLNLCKLLSRQDDLQVTLLLSHALDNRVLADELPPAICIVQPAKMSPVYQQNQNLTADTVADALIALEAREGQFDRILVRGAAYQTALLAVDTLASRVVCYATDIRPNLAAPEPAWLSAARATRRLLLVQSLTAKRVLESLCDYPAHLIHVVPPVAFAPPDPTPYMPRATLCYSGKIDPDYGLNWLVDLCDSVKDLPKISIRLIAAKDSFRARHPDFFLHFDRFRARVARGDLPGVTLASELPHAQARSLMAQADFAFGLRSQTYDDNAEISTKLLEFCAAGVPPIANDTALNRAFFGPDYPYLIDLSKGDPLPRLREILSQGRDAAYQLAQNHCLALAAQHAPEQVSRALRLAVGVAADTARRPNPRRILIATHDRKFIQQACDHLANEPTIQIRWQPWISHFEPAQALTVALDVDTVFCEWCCENAVWHSQNKAKGCKLIVRLHRFEAMQDFGARVNWSAVDALIVVSDHFRQLVIDRFGVDPKIIHVVPQYINWAELQRPKLPEARFTLGLVGINPFDQKRFDRALDFLAALRRHDQRFTLAVRSVMPWQIDWVWQNRPDSRDQVIDTFRRVYTDPVLAGAVRFDPPGSDMEEWYRGIGTILSSSDSEGCHTAVIEGIASGCYAVVHDWPGARGLFARFVQSDMQHAIADTISFADQPDLAAARAHQSAQMRAYDLQHFITKVLAL